MANQKHLKAVREGGEALLRLQAQLMKEGARLNLRDTDLCGANLINADLSKADLTGTDLSNAVLTGADFTNADLHNANLPDADLRDTDLREAMLKSADLSGADLSRAKLNGANLLNAMLSGANLSRAELVVTDLSHADLSNTCLSAATLLGATLSSTNVSGANFAGAGLGESCLGRLDLLSATGLDEIVHLGPSSLGLDSLARSQGRLPERFLKGCGLQDWEIENAKLYRAQLSEAATNDIIYRVFDLRHGPAVRLHPVFLSHAAEDKPFVRKLEQALQDQGVRCWLDEKELLPGQDLYEEVDRGVRLYDKTVLVCSEASLKSKWVERELRKVLQKEERVAKVSPKDSRLLVPIRLDDHVFEWDSGMQSEVTGRIVGDFSKHRSKKAFEAAVDQLVRALQTDGGRSAPPPSYLPSGQHNE